MMVENEKGEVVLDTFTHQIVQYMLKYEKNHQKTIDRVDGHRITLNLPDFLAVRVNKMIRSLGLSVETYGILLFTFLVDDYERYQEINDDLLKDDIVYQLLKRRLTDD